MNIHTVEWDGAMFAHGGTLSQGSFKVRLHAYRRTAISFVNVDEYRHTWRSALRFAMLALQCVCAGCYRLDTDRLAAINAWIHDAMVDFCWQVAAGAYWLLLLFFNILPFVIFGIIVMILAEQIVYHVSGTAAADRRAAERAQRRAQHEEVEGRAHQERAAQTAKELHERTERERQQTLQFQADVRDVEMRPHLAEEEWLEAFARKNAGHLIRQADEIRVIDRQFNESDRGTFLRDRAPEMFGRHRYLVRAAAIAERLSVATTAPNATTAQPTIEHKPTPPKETPDEYAARQGRHERNKGTVELHRQLARLEIEQRATEEISSRFPDLDEDERQRRVRELIEAAYESEAGRGAAI